MRNECLKEKIVRKINQLRQKRKKLAAVQTLMIKTFYFYSDKFLNGPVLTSKSEVFVLHLFEYMHSYILFYFLFRFFLQFMKNQVDVH